MKRLMKPIYASSENTYDIPVKWEVKAVLPVPASSLKEAVDIVNREDYALPDGGYVDDTYEIDYDSLDGK